MDCNHDWDDQYRYEADRLCPDALADYIRQAVEGPADYEKDMSGIDYRAAHLYNDNPEYYLAGTDRPFLVTETGVQDPARHVDWWTRTMTHISGVLATDRLYLYALAD